MLNKKEKHHIEISQAWFGLFQKLITSLSNPSLWWFDDFTSNLFHNISISNELEIKKIIKIREDSVLFSINEKNKKVVKIELAHKNFKTNYCYTSRWIDEIAGINYPFLIFIGFYTSDSFTEFERIFKKFMTINTDEEFKSFEVFIKNEYAPHLQK